MQVDFGEKRVTIAGTVVNVFLLVAVLSYSRRTFVKAFLHERHGAARAGVLLETPGVEDSLVPLRARPVRMPPA